MLFTWISLVGVNQGVFFAWLLVFMWYQNSSAGSDCPPQSATETHHFICSNDTRDAYCACFPVDRGHNGSTPWDIKGVVWLYAQCWCSFSVWSIGNRWSDMSLCTAFSTHAVFFRLVTVWAHPGLHTCVMSWLPVWKKMELIHHQCLWYTDRQPASSYEFQQVDIVPTSKKLTHSLLILLVWIHHLVCHV